MRTGNPALNAKTFTGYAATERAMTIEGTVNRTGLLLVLLLLGAGWSWRGFYAEGGGAAMPSIWGGGGRLGILFSLFVVLIAALNLVLDFDFIESGAAQGAPRFMEWYAAFGLMVTLIWLYLEILGLLGKRGRGD